MGWLVALLAALSAQAGEKSCPTWMHVTWKLDLGAGSVERMGRTGAQPFCKAPPEAGDENVRVEIVDSSGKQVFSRRVFASLDTHFDRLSDQGKLQGGRVPARETLIRAHLPAEIALHGEKFQIRFLAVSGDKLLAEGAL
jgi:hypothetical protein